GYLWTVPQEMFFYILLPALVAALYGVILLEQGLTARIPQSRRRLFQALGPGWLGLSALLAAIVVATWMAHHRAIILYGNGESRTAMVGIFMSGMFFSLLHHAVHNSPLLQGQSGDRVRRTLGLAGATALLFLTLISYRLLPGFQPLDIYRNFGYTGFLAAFIIFSVIISPGSLLAGCMGWTPLRAVGVVSFSFYLLHPTLIVLCRETSRYFFDVNPGPWPLFLLVTLVSYGFSMLTYSWIERPFMKH
ncbi:MAG: acyltransferase family protein, partial [Oscillospiraceae bacterium]|nr:acyltransferase family protein [Oscillospiraceae bacterium]